jgi:hypothetical protein
MESSARPIQELSRLKSKYLIDDDLLFAPEFVDNPLIASPDSECIIELFQLLDLENLHRGK